IPVHIISATPAERRSLERGALSFLSKPATEAQVRVALQEIRSFIERGVKKLLVVERDQAERDGIVELVGNGDVECVAVGRAEEALQALEAERFDCMVLELELPDMGGLELIERVQQLPHGQRLPILIYTQQPLSKEEEAELRRVSDTTLVRGVRSPERLLDQTALFLHRVQDQLPEKKREILRRLSHTDPALFGRKVMVVDDDVRNIFAITTILEQYRMKVVYAENGADALAKLQRERDVELVLMDIMMPEMDGYEATRRIRGMPVLSGLPIIALTAKAMKGDREKCIQAGASDYITKPIDPDQLVSLLRVWLYR